MEVEARLATESHPASRNHWVLTPEACRRAAEQLPGTVVTWNYDATRPLGRVVSAEADEEGVRVTMELDEVLPGLRTDEVGPGFARLGAISVPDEVPERVTDLDVREVALLPSDPGDEDG